MGTTATTYRPASRWHPGGVFHQFRNLRRLTKSLTHAPVTIGFDGGLQPGTTCWTFAPALHGGRMAIQFRCEADLVRLTHRWRLLADILHRRGTADRQVRFHDILIHLEDGCGHDTPPDVFAFARPRGSRAGLIPNPYLLEPPRWLPAPLPWDRKTDTVYFRGATTGSSDYASNVRVVLCKAAQAVPDADCRISANVHTDEAFARPLARDGLLGAGQPLHAMNRHKYLIDADGNTSSYDRYKFIGLFGGVPIRFESGWEECWHELLVDGVNYVQADRDSLPDVVDRLRSRPRDAAAIATAAQQLVKRHLAPEAARERLARTLSRA